MKYISPTVTATDEETFNKQLNLLNSFAKRIHIDLMDGIFTPTKSPSEDLLKVSSPAILDVHVMYDYPLNALDTIIEWKPNLVIVHSECKDDLNSIISKLKNNDIKVGLALLPETTVESVKDILPRFDHVLIFGGNLGYQGGKPADLKQLIKVDQCKLINNNLEFGWDGGANSQNCAEIANAGINVINVGSAIQKAPNPAQEYVTLTELATK